MRRTSDELVIVTRGLTRRFGRRLACDAVDLAVPRGGVFGLLGRNGAGKTTCVKLLMGLLRPTSGEARVLGLPAGHVAARRHVGFLPEGFRFPEWLTGAEVLAFHAALADVPRARRAGRIAAALDAVGLGGEGHRLVRAYSKGMQQRLGLACALLADPPLLVLDEPTSALDPLGRREVRQLLRRLAAEGKTILLNSHLLAEVEAVCSGVAVMRQGRIVAQGALPALLGQSLDMDLLLAGGEDAEAALRACAARGWRAVALPPGTDAAGEGGPGADGGAVRVRVEGVARPGVPEVAAAVVGAGARLYELRTRHRTLEDVFVELVADPPAPL